MINSKHDLRMKDIKRSIEFACGEISVIMVDIPNDSKSKPYLTWKSDCLILQHQLDILHCVLDTLEKI
jgi:hypothetical protein